MRPLFDDTSPEAEAVLLELMRQTPSWRKLQIVDQLNARVRALLLIGLRERHPDASEAELYRRLADLLLGPELAAEVYGPLPDGSEPTLGLDAEGLRAHLEQIRAGVDRTLLDLLMAQ